MPHQREEYLVLRRRGGFRKALRNEEARFLRFLEMRWRGCSVVIVPHLSSSVGASV